MKKTLSIILSIVMLLSAFSVLAGITAFAADDAGITIDGAMDDIYKDITPIVIKDADSSAEKANVYVAWDNENMYIFVDVKDTKVVEEDGTLNWDATDDYVEIRIDLLHDKNKGGYYGGWGGDYRGNLMCEAVLRINPGSNSDGSARFGTGFSYGDEWWGNAIYNWDNSTGMGVSVINKDVDGNDTGYTVEYRLPTTIAADIPDAIKPHVGQVIGFGVKINDNEDGNAYWEPSHDNMWSPSTLTDLTLNESNYVGEEGTARRTIDSITEAGNYYTCLRNPANGGYYDHGWYSNASSIGIKTTIPDGLSLTKVNVNQINTGDVYSSKYTLKVYTWEGSVEASVKENALYTSDTFTLNSNDGTVAFDIADTTLNGDLYIEVSANEGTFMFVKACVADNNAYTFFVNGAEVDGVLGTKGYFEVGVDPYATTVLDKTENSYEFWEGNCGGWFDKKSIGHKFTVAEGLKVTSIATGEILGDPADYVIKVYEWKGNYADTVAKDALYTKEFNNGAKDASYTVDDIDVVLSGDLYWELTRADGTAKVTYFVADNSESKGLGATLIDGVYSSHDAKATIKLGETSIKQANVSLGKEIALNVYATENAKMDFTMNGITYTDNDGELQNNGTYKYTFTVTPQCMGDTIEVELIKDGAVIESRTTTIKDVLEATVAANTENETLETLVNALINYGAAAQKFTGHNAADVVVDVSGFDELVGNILNVKDGYVDGLIAAGVNFDNKNRVYFVFNEKPDGEVYINGLEENKLVSGEERANGEWVYYSEYLGPTDFDWAITLELKDETATYTTATYSVNCYVLEMQNDPNMGELVKALYLYGQAAEAYNPQ